MKIRLGCALALLIGLSPVNASTNQLLTTKLSADEVRTIAKRYNKLWSSFTSNDEKIAFAHTFLKQIT